MNIWHIDDDQEMLQVIRLLLKMLGHNTRTFISVRDAVKLLNYGEKPDLLLLDLYMPEINGFDMIEYLRRQPEWQNLPIIVLSAEYHPEEIKHTFDLGVDAYLCKPITIEELEKAIEQALAHVQNR